MSASNWKGWLICKVEFEEKRSKSVKYGITGSKMDCIPGDSIEACYHKLFQTLQRTILTSDQF